MAVRGHDSLCSTVQYLQFKIREEYGTYRPLWLRTWQQWLMAICYCLDPFIASTNEVSTVGSSRRPRKDKFGMVSKICTQQQNA